MLDTEGNLYGIMNLKFKKAIGINKNIQTLFILILHINQRLTLMPFSFYKKNVITSTNS